MTLKKKRPEIRRLIKAFEAESNKFHELTFSIFGITQQGPNSKRTFREPNHAIVLWQYYGKLDVEKNDGQKLAERLESSNFKWGVRGTGFSLYGVLEGSASPMFVRMASRAGSLFNEKEAALIKDQFGAQLSDDGMLKPGEKTVTVTNNNPLAIWLNYLLFYLSVSNPGREQVERIEPDPFALSLIALEQLLEEPTISKSDRSTTNIENIKFSVAVSFSGTVRPYVSDVVQALRPKLEKDAIFYDFDYQAQLARPNLDTLLQDIYGNRSKLLVVFLEKDYATRDWCGIEWRAIREIIKTKQDRKIMLVRFDQAKIEGIFSTDGYIDASKTNPRRVAEYIKERLDAISA